MTRKAIKLYQSSSSLVYINNFSLEPMDPTMLHAIKLHKYYNDLMDKVHIAGSTMEPVSNSSTISVPTVPEMPEIPKKHSKNSLNFIPKEFT